MTNEGLTKWVRLRETSLGVDEMARILGCSSPKTPSEIIGVCEAFTFVSDCFYAHTHDLPDEWRSSKCKVVYRKDVIEHLGASFFRWATT